MKIMMPKQTAIKRFLSYCAKKKINILDDFQFQPDVFDIDDPNCKIRICRVGNGKPRMIVFHTKQDCERNDYPAISEMNLTEDEYNEMKMAFLKETKK